MNISLAGVLLLIVACFCCTTAFDLRHVKCLVCRITVEEIEKVIAKVDPKRKIDIGSYRLDGKGNQKQKNVLYARSETHLTDLMDTVCEKLDDYAKATYKSNGELTILKMVDDNGRMNSEMGNVDFVQDGDLNKSLKYYCERIVEEYEENVIKLFGENQDNIDIKLCTDAAKYCDVTHNDNEDYVFEDKEEL